MADNVREQTFNVSGMHCKSCGASIDMELADLMGVREARTSLTDNTTVVSFDPSQVTAQDIIAAIGRAGFEATPA